MKTLTQFTRRSAVTSLAFALALSTSGMSAAAEVSFEGKTIDIMVNFAAGGGTDTAARLVAPFIAKNLPGTPGSWSAIRRAQGERRQLNI